MLRDVPLAEDLTQDTLVAALEHWPAAGVPENPGAWLMATAKRRALDHLRRGQMLARKHGVILSDLEQEQQTMPDPDAALDDDVRRRAAAARLHRLPSAAVARGARRAGAAHDLRADDRGDRARFPDTGGDRGPAHRSRQAHAVGLRSCLRDAGRDELSERLASVLEVVYLVFNEGYTAARGDEWLRPQLCNEALRLGRMLTAIAPQEPETHGLLALMELNASRSAARTDAQGDTVLLMEQDRARWDLLQIGRGLRSLVRAEALGGAGGFYALQAAIVACHARAGKPEETNWHAIASLYARACGLDTFARDRAQSRGRGRHGRGPRGGTCDYRRSSRARLRSGTTICCRRFAATSWND